MAEYRSVQTRMWREDEWFQSLDTDARLLFIYLFTNPSASVAGIYRLPMRTIEFESGIELARVKELLAEFATAGKVHYENGIVWVVRMRENQLPGETISSKVQARLDKDVASIPSCNLKNRYLKHYGYPIDTLSIPNHTDTDTDTDTVTDTVTDTDTVTVQRRLPSGKRTPKQQKPKPEPKPVHPAVQAYRDMHRRMPNAAQIALIEARNPDIAAWVRAMQTWAGRGYNPQNIEGQLDWADNPALMERKGNGNGSTNGNGTNGNGQPATSGYAEQLAKKFG